MNPDTILETRQLTMRFGGLTAVGNFSAAITRGSIVGLIGPNGAGKTTRWHALFSLPASLREENALKEKSLNLLEVVGLRDLADEKSTSLPYGAQRRLEIARALATDPAFLLLDEPAAGMNPNETRKLMDFIRQIRDRFHLTILLIEHDMRVVMGICEHIWVLDYGETIARGSPEQIKANSKVIEAYLVSIQKW
jgi:branched-chain amino acid transport system ATP-binding protein